MALKSDAAKKNTILTYLGQIWHLMALVMLDKGAFTLQKKAIFAFLTKRDKEASTALLLANPFNWVQGQQEAAQQAAFDFKQSDFTDLLDSLYQLRNVFTGGSVEEPLEVPCQMLGA